MEDHETGHYLTYQHNTQAFFRGHRDKFEGVIVPLSIATVFRQGTGGFILTLRKPYAIDPRTPIFQAAFERSSLRKSHRMMAEVHGTALSDIIEERPVMPTDFSSALIDETAANVIRFQREFAATSAKKASKYARMLGQEVQSSYEPPAFCIPPYFRASSLDDGWYEISLRSALSAAAAHSDVEVWPVIHIDSRLSAEVERLQKDYSDPRFSGLVLFVNDFKECERPESDLQDHIGLVRGLAATGKPVVSLFGGYFYLLLLGDCLRAFSNGVGYGEYRGSAYHQGGQALRRYYHPILHRYLTDTDAQTLLAVMHDLPSCDCPTCRGRSDIVGMSNGDLLDHFMEVRKRELDALRSRPILESVEQLRTDAAVFAEAPDPVPPWGAHLSRWANALTAAL